MPRFDEGHALLIGLANYQDPSLRLPVPVTVADAEEVTNALRDPATCAYRDGQVQLLRDGEATRAAVIDALNALATKKADDTVFIFFSGHGVLGEDGLYYLTTHDTILTSLNLARKDTGVSAPQFLDLLRNIKARRLLLLVNSCFSGHIAPTLAPGDALRAPISTTLGTQVLGAGEGRVLITASRPTQYSYYRQQDKHTFFGQALVDGLRGKGAPSSGGYVGLYELYQYLYTRVTNAVSALGGVQEPVLNIVKGVGPFPVALHSGGTLGALTPSAIQQGPPNGAVEVVVQAIGRGAQAFNFQAGVSGDVVGRDNIRAGQITIYQYGPANPSWRSRDGNTKESRKTPWPRGRLALIGLVLVSFLLSFLGCWWYFIRVPTFSGSISDYLDLRDNAGDRASFFKANAPRRVHNWEGYAVGKTTHGYMVQPNESDKRQVQVTVGGDYEPTLPLERYILFTGVVTGDVPVSVLAVQADCCPQMKMSR